MVEVKQDVTSFTYSKPNKSKMGFSQ
jgi:hypothetical protein